MHAEQDTHPIDLLVGRGRGGREGGKLTVSSPLISKMSKIPPGPAPPKQSPHMSCKRDTSSRQRLRDGALALAQTDTALCLAQTDTALRKSGTQGSSIPMQCQERLTSTMGSSISKGL